MSRQLVDEAKQARADAGETIWKQTASGAVWRVLHPRIEDVRFLDIAEALARCCRFAGHVQRGHYSVAQHSVIVCDALEPAGRTPLLYGLLHDAHEAYLGDWTSPVKAALRQLGGGEALRQLENRTAAAIHAAAGLAWPPPKHIADAIATADLRALVTERRDLLARKPQSWGNAVERARPFSKTIRPWPFPEAVEMFLDRLARHGLRNVR